MEEKAEEQIGGTNCKSVCAHLSTHKQKSRFCSLLDDRAFLEILRLIRSATKVGTLAIGVVVIGLRRVFGCWETTVINRTIEIDAWDGVRTTHVLGNIFVSAAHQTPHQNQNEHREREDSEG